MEIRAIFRELLGRLDTIELDGDVTFVESRLVSGPKQLPVRFTWKHDRARLTGG